ncbi:MAG: hypothetical protein INQ03_18535 [Candidatus Heimdallarchaeota archaeon]|nr:hypothetical protein [Candidatus Heimdallarchaeota archaeon]
MLMKYIDAIKCPVCKESRLWKIDGDFTDDRMIEGKVTCKNGHRWIVKEEVWRLDKEGAEEDMQFLGHSLTGFPSQIKETVRGDFLVSMKLTVEEYVKSSDKPLFILGSPILFLKYLPTTEREIVVVNESEGILRQAQEIAVSKRIYKQLSCIRATEVDSLLPEAERVYVFDNVPDELQNNDTAFLVERDPNAEVLWEGEECIFMKKESD